MKKYVCAFLDILGAKEKMVSEEFALKLDKWFSGILLYDRKPIVVRSFADTIILAEEIDDDLYTPFLRVATIANILCQKAFFEIGCLLRGGIAHGELHIGKNTITGPALKRVYEIETREAIYPRIVIDDNTIYNLTKDEDEEHRKILDFLLRSDRDGRLFVQYLSSYIRDGNGKEIAFESINNKFTEMYRGVDAPEIIQKYEWWANEINRDLEIFGYSRRLHCPQKSPDAMWDAFREIAVEYTKKD